MLKHDCINRRLAMANALYAWEFEKDSKELRVRVDGRLTLNDEATMVAAALDGVGIAYVPEDMVAGHLADGALELLLDDWSPRFSGITSTIPAGTRTCPPSRRWCRPCVNSGRGWK